MTLLDDPRTTLRAPTCLEDALQIITAAGAPMTAAGLMARLVPRWTQPVSASAVQALLAARRIEWVTVAGRDDCLQLFGWRPEDAAPSKPVRVPIRPVRQCAPNPPGRKAPRRGKRGETRARLEALLDKPMTLADCSAALGITATPLLKQLRALIDEGRAEICGEMGRTGRGRGTRLYINTRIARKAA